MNGNWFYIFNNMFSFNPDRQKGINFHIWEYNPEITIDLSLSFYHRILVNESINIYFKNPKIGYLYLIQMEVRKIEFKLINFLSSDNIEIIFTHPYSGLILYAYGDEYPSFSIDYCLFLCRPGNLENTYILDCILATPAVCSL